MLKLFLTANEQVHEKTKNIISKFVDGEFEILTGENGKPYIRGNPVYFSISHSGQKAVIAVSDKPVGVDFEDLKKRKISSVLSRFTPREKHETGGDIIKFYKNWVAKEAYIKLIGGALAKDLKKLEFFGGKLFYGGASCNTNLSVINIKNAGICAICGGQLLFDDEVINLD